MAEEGAREVERGRDVGRRHVYHRDRALSPLAADAEPTPGGGQGAEARYEEKEQQLVAASHLLLCLRY